jgi:hypothetical protein
MPGNAKRKFGRIWVKVMAIIHNFQFALYLLNHWMKIRNIWQNDL